MNLAGLFEAEDLLLSDALNHAGRRRTLDALTARGYLRFVCALKGLCAYYARTSRL